MKKKIIIICISIIILLSIGVGCFVIISNNKQKTFNEIKTLLEQDNYGQVKTKINESKLDTKEKDKINELILTRLTRYKVNNYDDFKNLTKEDWENIKEFSSLIDDLKLIERNKKFKYASELLKLEDYKKYIPAINWQNSDDYKVWHSYIDLKTENDFSKVASVLPKYSFEKYGLENVYIKELNEEKDKFSQYCKTASEAIDESNLNKYDSVYNKLKDSVSTMYDIEMKIISTHSELETKIKELPII